MTKEVKSLLFVICIVMVFTAQSYRSDDKEKQGGNPPAQRGQTKEGPTRNVQSAPRPSSPSEREPAHKEPNPTRNEAPKPVFNGQPIRQGPFDQGRQRNEPPRVYAVVPSAPVENNNLFHRQHHNGWKPRYNFYDNQYHFYPYVNIAAMVEFSGSYETINYNGQVFFYDDGTFYQQADGGQYVAVAPPVGIIVNPIVPQARQIIVNNQVFYRYKGIFYVQVAQGYEVIDPIESDTEGE